MLHVLKPTFLIKRKEFDHYRFGKKDVELRATHSKWKNAKTGDIATIQCGKRIFRKRITSVHRGSLARIFLKIHYKRIFPETESVLEAAKLARKLISSTEEFMAFELEDFK